MPSAVLPYERLKKRARVLVIGRRKRRRMLKDGDAPVVPPPQLPGPTDSVFPGNHIKLFNGILRRSGLKLDRNGNKRTAYSLRHTYICMRLMEGADIYQIAKNCRTSVEMIDKFYAAHIKNTLDAASINVMRRRPPKEPTLTPHQKITLRPRSKQEGVPIRGPRSATARTERRD